MPEVYQTRNIQLDFTNPDSSLTSSLTPDQLKDLLTPAQVEELQKVTLAKTAAVSRVTYAIGELTERIKYLVDYLAYCWAQTQPMNSYQLSFLTTVYAKLLEVGEDLQSVLVPDYPPVGAEDPPNTIDESLEDPWTNDYPTVGAEDPPSTSPSTNLSLRLKRTIHQPQLSQESMEGFSLLSHRASAIAITSRLTGSQFRLWHYLMMIDPFADQSSDGERIYHDLPSPAEIGVAIGANPKTVEKDMKRLEKLGLYAKRITGWQGYNLTVEKGRQAATAMKLAKETRQPIPVKQPPEPKKDLKPPQDKSRYLAEAETLTKQGQKLKPLQDKSRYLAPDGSYLAPDGSYLAESQNAVNHTQQAFQPEKKSPQIYTDLNKPFTEKKEADLLKISREEEESRRESPASPVAAREEEKTDSLRSIVDVGGNPHTPLPPPPENGSVAPPPPSQGLPSVGLRQTLDTEPPATLSEGSHGGGAEIKPNCPPVQADTSTSAYTPASLEDQAEVAEGAQKGKGRDNSAPAPTAVKETLAALYGGAGSATPNPDAQQPRRQVKPRPIPSRYIEEVREVLFRHQRQLVDLGIDLANNTLLETVNAHPHNLEPAIQAFLENCAKRAIANPNPYLSKAIREGWKPRNQQSTSGSPKSALSPEFLKAYERLKLARLVLPESPESLPVIMGVVNVRIPNPNPRPWEPPHQLMPWDRVLTDAVESGQLLEAIGDLEW